MNSRLKEKGVLVQRENDVQIRGPPIPPTLGNNPILSRSNSISIERMGNRMGRRNWGEFLKIMDQRSEQTMNYDQTMNYNRASNNSDPTGLMYQISSSSYGVVDHRPGNGNFGHHYLSSQAQPFCNNIPSWSNNYTAPNRRFSGETVPQGIHGTNMSPVMIPRTDSAAASLSLLNLNMRMLGSGTVLHSNMNLQNTPAVLNSYSEVDSSWTEANFTSLLLGNEIPGLGPNNNLINANSSTQMTSDGLHAPLVRNHNLNSPPRWDGDAISSNTNSFPYAPITPDYRRNMFKKRRPAEVLKFLLEEGSSQEHAKMENLYPSIGNEAIENHCNELIQTIVDSSSGVLSTPLMENKCSNRGDQGAINMNETPKQKAPKRRKHRPKVVIEGKFRRTPKVKTPKDAGLENPPTKRKYVRKQRDPEAENTALQQKDAINTGTVPNLETREKSSRKRLSFEIEKGEMQDQAGKVQAENHQQNQQGLNLNLNYPANQMLVKGTTNYNKTLNVIARNFSSRKDEKWEHPHPQVEFNRNISQANNSLVRYREMRWKSTHQMVERDVGNFKGFCGSKSEYIDHTEQVGPSSEHRQAIQLENQETISTKDETSSEEARKKQKTETRSSLQSSGALLSYSQGDRITMNQQTVPEKRGAMASRSTQAHDNAYLAVMTNLDLQSAIMSEKAINVGYQKGSENNDANTQRNQLNMAPIASNADSIKARGQPEAKRYSKKMIEEITYRLQILNIRDGSGETDGKDKYALVPYEGGGAMVMYEHRKRKPRPKVDLDPETTRIWKLLMGKEGSEASEAENTDKEKWWQEERRVFQGRADSFIARMHLVQGDRRFSPWKGSVVDSVIGVFLTQNVSDHLSSSAFMALAAQFPLCSTTPDQASDQSGTSILTEEPEIQGRAPYGNIGCLEKITMQPLYTHISGSYLESSRMGLAAEPNGISEENASSSQNSSDSFVLHINGEIQSSSGSNSEAEDSGHGAKPIKINGLKSVQLTNRTTTIPILQTPENESACFDDCNKQIQGPDKFNNQQSFSTLTHPINSSISNMQNPNTPRSYFQLLMEPDIETREDCFAISREDSISSFPSRAPKMMSNSVGHAAEMTTKPLSQQDELPKSRVSNTDPFALITKHLTAQKCRLEPVPQTAKASPFVNNHQGGRCSTFESENMESEKPSRPVETVIIRKSVIGDQVPNATKHTGPIVDIKEGTAEANKQVFLDETSAGASTKTLNPSQKHEKEKRDLVDWDNLRRTALAKGRSKERSMGSLDSMDYEAMRCADVDKISSSIKIRGMNNMLADRIKDFLNRVARDHGSIDLEWLRDVPPDKAKDYLLSIRGLGLKSVECVRLLTLHHIAFPVDTNVGRIAVRLGWVPLQPLPESLQLHLLEMYPVLESVQKYLWPRLCKLDQRTLYELHYQLITFGKVFCTKSKPNCNACPMRGECRHFASAFASARLALPAPEEKSIVGPTMPIATEPTAHDMAIKPMLLQPSGSYGDGQLEVSRCEPIIEEPATPKPETTEIIETDIEDAFLEDPDEIPTIKLNVEQLAINLRNFMEQESDMSKAIVALTPEVASIPAPKLKYVLRLRTERQVYVLTDTHPLVKGLDKREPDDPSPYLLALLAPGETSSGHPSKSCCECNGPGELCNEKNEEANPLTVQGTLLIPCRTAMRGRFPLNGTYFQVNEVFADHESSLDPIEVPRAWLWHLEMRTVYFGTSATSIFRGMTTKEIQNSFWRGFVCVRGFDRKTRAPRPLNRNLHIPQSRLVKPSDAAK